MRICLVAVEGFHISVDAGRSNLTPLPRNDQDLVPGSFDST